ncbi:MAG: phosphotransferase [Ilumatobacteraceae bacterium]
MLGTTSQQLLEAIRAECGNDRIEWAAEPTVLAGGFSSQMWLLEIIGDDRLAGALVGRVLPGAEIAPREVAVQTHLASAGFATPAVRLSGAPGRHLDHPWMVMDRVVGTPLLAGLSGLSALARLPDLARTVPDTLAGCAASLHSYDPDPLTESFGLGDDVLDFLTQMRDRMVANDRTDLVALADDLLATRPNSDRVVICHGDLHPFNVLTGPAGATVIDWTTARRADPTFDLAFTNLLLTHPPLRTPRALAPVLNRVGGHLGRRFLDRYCDETNFRLDRDALNWFTLLSSLRILVELANLRAEGQSDPSDHPFVDMEPALRRLVAERG